jgi:hypothetical protein
MNYTELTAAVQSYTETQETAFVATIPTFIRQAEERIVRNPQVRIAELRKNSTSTLTAGDLYLTRPADFIAVSSLSVVDLTGAHSYLYDKDVNFIREAYPDPATTGLPRFYGQFDGDRTSPATEGHFIIGPTPDEAYAVDLHYYYDPPSIVDTETSWFGENAETALLYGTLLEAYVFLKGDADLMQTYSRRYDEGMAMLGVVGLRAGRDNYKDGELTA